MCEVCTFEVPFKSQSVVFSILLSLHHNIQQLIYCQFTLFLQCFEFEQYFCLEMEWKIWKKTNKCRTWVQLFLISHFTLIAVKLFSLVLVATFSDVRLQLGEKIFIIVIGDWEILLFVEWWNFPIPMKQDFLNYSSLLYFLSKFVQKVLALEEPCFTRKRKRPGGVICDTNQGCSNVWWF